MEPTAPFGAASSFWLKAIESNGSPISALFVCRGEKRRCENHDAALLVCSTRFLPKLDGRKRTCARNSIRWNGKLCVAFSLGNFILPSLPAAVVFLMQLLRSLVFDFVPPSK